MLNYLISIVPTSISEQSFGGSIVFFSLFGLESYGAIVPLRTNQKCYTFKLGLIVHRLNIGLTFNLVLEEK